jgi:hypothetical protein
MKTKQIMGLCAICEKELYEDSDSGECCWCGEIVCGKHYDDMRCMCTVCAKYHDEDDCD